MKKKKAAYRSPYWDRLRKELKVRDGVTYQFGQSTNPGSHTLEIFHRDMPMPLCVVWFNFFGLKGIQILNSFTFEHARRCGLRTYAHEMLIASYPERYILSGAGTESGSAWMKAVGYKQTAAGWEFRPRRKAASHA